MKAYNPTKVPSLRCRWGFHKWEERGTAYGQEPGVPYGQNAYAHYCVYCGGVKEEYHPHAQPNKVIINGWHCVGYL